MEEATTASDNWVSKGNLINIVIQPTESEVDKANLDKKMKIEKSCKEAMRLDKIGRNTIWHSYKFNQLSQDCLQSPTAITSKDLVKKLPFQTRRCNLETVASQIVCKEIKVKGEEISQKEYSLLKKEFKYFRF